MMNQVRILIADDYEVVRRGMRCILEVMPHWKVVAEAATGREAVEKAAEFKPDIVLLDIGMPELSGLEAMRQILKNTPETKVLIFTEDESEDLARAALESGALGYLFKSATNQQLLAAVESLRQDRPYLAPSVSRMMLELYRNRSETNEARPNHQRLTPREREILQSVAEGNSTKEVASRLHVSPKTVETHRANIMRKLQFSSLADLVRYAIRNRIITP